MILHIGHLQSRAVAFYFDKDHFVEDKVTYHSRTWVHRYCLPQEKVLLLLVVEILVVAVDDAKLERLDACGGERACVSIFGETAIFATLDHVVISIGEGIFRNVQVSKRFSQLLIRAYLNFVDDLFVLQSQYILSVHLSNKM